MRSNQIFLLKDSKDKIHNKVICNINEDPFIEDKIGAYHFIASTPFVVIKTKVLNHTIPKSPRHF